MLLYIHIPYCDSKCHYCSFNSYVDKFDTRAAYMQSLYRQLTYELDRFEAKEKSIETLFIGGGTPSTISAILYSPIFDLLRPYLKSDAEVTTEANPNSATREWMEGMRDLGINRISFGVQSFDYQKLKALNRAHSPKDAIESIKSAKEIGIEHISLDIIYNYIGDTKELLKNDIDTALSLPIDHISAYELTIEPHTAFSKTPEVRQSDDELAFFVADTIVKRGFDQYEISNFGRYHSRHNRGYWRLHDYIGAGAGAVGFLKDRRYYPHTDIDRYINAPLDISTEILTPIDILTERIFLGLRSDIGIEREVLSVDMQVRADFLVSKGKLSLQAGIYKNSNLFLADEVALYIID